MLAQEIMLLKWNKTSNQKMMLFAIYVHHQFHWKPFIAKNVNLMCVQYAMKQKIQRKNDFVNIYWKKSICFNLI
jgi:hypothetical protein